MNFTVTVASDNEREDLFAEICYGDQQWAEVIANSARGGFTIEIFAPEGAASYRFPLDTFQRAIEEARARLVALGYPERARTPRYVTEDCQPDGTVVRP